LVQVAGVVHGGVVLLHSSMSAQAPELPPL
jgi:hypothetical protein